MLLPDFRVSKELQYNAILHCITSCILEHFYFQCNSMFSLGCYGYLTLFEYILRSKFKKWENEDDLNLLLNWPNFLWNGIIIPMLLVTAFFKVTHQKVYLSVN